MGRIRVLSEIGEPAYAVAPGLFVIWASRLLELTLNAGSSPAAPFAFAAFALVLCASEQHIDTGYDLAKQAILSLEPMQATAAKCKVYNIFGGTIQPWKEPLANTLSVLAEGIASGSESGDYASGAYNALAASMHAFFMGMPLPQVDRHLRSNLSAIASFRQSAHWHWVASYLSLTRQLSGSQTAIMTALAFGPEAPFDPIADLERADLAGDKCGLAHANLLRLILHFHTDHLELARAHADQVRQHLAGFQGTFAVPVFYFYDALSRLRQEGAGGIGEAQANLERLTQLARFCPSNLQHKCSLISAEIARLKGKYWEATALYDAAITGASSQQSHGDEGLAAELAFRFFRDQGLAQTAASYARRARSSFEAWGAEALVARWRSAPQSGETLSEIKQLQSPDSRGDFDLESVLRATRAISGEIDPDRLITVLLKTLIVGAGARRAQLIVKKPTGWMLEAEIDAEEPERPRLCLVPLGDCPQLAITVVRYVARTGEPVLLADAAREGGFDRDPHISSQTVRSILCTPLTVQGRLSGIIYLENALVKGAFSEERKELIDVLAAQAAISLESARHFQELEELNRSLSQEIIERKRAQTQLQESEESFRQFILRCPIPIAIFASDGRTELINEQFTTTFGYTAADVPDEKSWWPQAYPDPTLRKDSQERWARLHAEAAASLADVPMNEYRISTKQGKPREVEVHARLIGGRTLAIFNDVTLRNQAERERHLLEGQLQQSQKMEAIGTLAGGIAHDFNNILSGIVGFSDEAMSYLPESSPAHCALEQVVTCSKRATLLVRQILTFGRKSAPERHPVSITKIAIDTISLLRATLPSTIEIVTHLDECPGKVLADPTQIQQVLMNLCTNATHAMEQSGGRLEISVLRRVLTAESTLEYDALTPGSYVELAVRDTGTGIDPAVLGKIFEPFFTTKEAGRGTGLGLAVVHGIVKGHGGTIVTESHLGQGTTFRVILPLSNAEMPRSEGRPDELRHGAERILVVDDESVVLSVHLRSLTSLGYAAVGVRSAQEALDRLEETPGAFAAIITDQSMPHMSGRALASQVRLRWPTVPVVLTTGYLGDETDGVDNAVSAVLRKPFTRLELSRVVRSVLDQNPKATEHSIETGPPKGK